MHRIILTILRSVSTLCHARKTPLFSHSRQKEVGAFWEYTAHLLRSLLSIPNDFDVSVNPEFGRVIATVPYLYHDRTALMVQRFYLTILVLIPLAKCVPLTPENAVNLNTNNDTSKDLGITIPPQPWAYTTGKTCLVFLESINQATGNLGMGTRGILATSNGQRLSVDLYRTKVTVYMSTISYTLTNFLI